MMPFAYLFLGIQPGPALENLPVDEVMAHFEAQMPEFKQFNAELDAELGQLGPVERGWSKSGITFSAAIEKDGKSTAEYALGEWKAGGNYVVTRGDRPLAVPEDFSRYIVREYTGPLSHNYYYRIAGVPGKVVIHSYGMAHQIGNGECQNVGGIELLSSERWQEWSGETMLVVFSLIRATRDDAREYCNIFRPVKKGEYRQFSYTSAGQPYSVGDGAKGVFVVTSLHESRKRLFLEESKAELHGE